MGPSIKNVIQKGEGGGQYKKDVMSLVRKGRHFKDFLKFFVEKGVRN